LPNVIYCQSCAWGAIIDGQVCRTAKLRTTIPSSASCLGRAERWRPTALVSEPGSGCIFHVFKREKQDVKAALVAVGRQELAGTWQAVRYALNGNKATDEDMRKIQLVFDAEGKASALRESKVFIAATTKIDPTLRPMTIDMNYTEGDPKGTTTLGIYKIEDDLLTICCSAPGKARPAEFSSKPGSDDKLMIVQFKNR
jgi:uncharacterized protein (TIGR03067 family)